MQLGNHRAPLAAAQVANILRDAITNRFEQPGGTHEFSLQAIDLTQGWSVTVSAQSLLQGLRATVASVSTALYFWASAPPLPELLDAVEAQLGDETHAILPMPGDRSFTKKVPY